jgi:catechol 2,3-dioxygenase-like lactoylglutathione lyase family enzyme
VDRAREFHERGLGGIVIEQASALFVTLGGRASRLSLRQWNEVATDGGVEPASSGFRGFTLSFIVDSADAVDQILERATQHGGTVSKPPKNAVWGYSAYVTDPDGYLWKIASSKRRPLFGHKSTAGAGEAVRPKEVPLTIGVADMKLAKAFYEDGIGLPVKKAYGTKFVMFGGDGESSDLGMYKREALADDAAVSPDGAGFHGFTITHTVASAEHAEDLLARAERAGGTVLKRPGGSAGGDDAGSFADLDGHVWQIARRHG